MPTFTLNGTTIAPGGVFVGLTTWSVTLPEG
jgi:hypothetical protein